MSGRVTIVVGTHMSSFYNVEIGGKEDVKMRKGEEGVRRQMMDTYVTSCETSAIGIAPHAKCAVGGDYQYQS